MMTSTFPTGRNNPRIIKTGLKEIQNKKETLAKLETALKNRITEFRELCLKEGELTGHLPADYPLQRREPIPQVRRRVTRSNGNIYENFTTTPSITPPSCFEEPIKLPHREPSKLSLDEPSKLNDLTNDVTKFQPYYEETKPFQMSDFYKYSSKHRQQQTDETVIPVVNNSQPQRPQRQHQQLNKQPHQLTQQHQQPNQTQLLHQQQLPIQHQMPSRTTRQLQEDVSRMKNPLKFAACDDQIQQSVKLIEKSRQKLLHATAKAIANNPSLAERLNNILPSHNHNINANIGHNLHHQQQQQQLNCNEQR